MNAAGGDSATRQTSRVSIDAERRSTWSRIVASLSRSSLVENTTSRTTRTTSSSTPKKTFRIPIMTQVVHKGMMKKKPFHPGVISAFFSISRNRFFVLEKDGILSYYRTEEDFERNPTNKVGEVEFQADTKVSMDEQVETIFYADLVCKDCGIRHTFILEAEGKDSCQVWVAKLKSVVNRMSNKVFKGEEISKHLNASTSHHVRRSVVTSDNYRSTTMTSLINAADGRMSVAPTSPFGGGGTGGGYRGTISYLNKSGGSAHMIVTSQQTLSSTSMGFHPMQASRESMAVHIGAACSTSTENVATDVSLKKSESEEKSSEVFLWRGKPMDNLTKNFFDILVDRNGRDSQSYMRTECVILEIFRDRCYKIFDRLESGIPNLTIMPNGLKPNLIPKDVEFNPTSKLPRYIEFDYLWNVEVVVEDQDENNIFGTNTTIEIDADELFVPLNEATKENLAYFTSVLLDANDIFQFELPDKSPSLPLTVMSVGATYANNFIMEGAGAYLEWHDVPHFHMPLNSEARGQLVLGVLTESGTIKLAAFKIPFGKAVYMNPFTLHNDCFLVGDFGCVYASTENFATGVVLNNKNESVDFKFV